MLRPYRYLKQTETFQTSSYTVPVGKDDLLDLQTLSKSLLGWRGGLEDAAVITIAFRYRCPVWTINYRAMALT